MVRGGWEGLVSEEWKAQAPVKEVKETASVFWNSQVNFFMTVVQVSRNHGCESELKQSSQ